MQLLCTWDCLLSGSPQSQREDYDKTRFPAVCWKYEQSEYRFPAVCWKYEQSEYRFPAVCWNMSRRQASNGICGIVCVASIFMCLELWVDRGRSPHQSHVGGVAPALLPTPFIPHARVAALQYYSNDNLLTTIQKIYKMKLRTSLRSQLNKGGSGNPPPLAP